MLRVALLLAVSLHVVAHNEGAPDSRNVNPYWLAVDGLPGRNPTIALSPGDDVTVTFDNAGDRAHQLTFGAPINASTALVEPNGSATLRFRVPDTPAASAYWCALHRSIGMVGAVSIGGAKVDPRSLSDATRPDLLPGPALPIVLAAIALAALGRRR